MPTIEKQNQHRIQLNKAFIYLKKNLSKKISLNNVAQVSGASQYHFIRIFNTYTGETPFSFLRRERVAQALVFLNETNLSITEIALDVGFDSSSAFNKAFKKVTNLSPGEFRNLGKEEQKKIIYDHSMPPRTKEIIMSFDMNLEPEIVVRKETVVYLTGAQGGDFKDVAPIAWENILKLIPKINEDLEHSEFLGIGSMYSEDTKKVCDYKAGFSLPQSSNVNIEGLKKEILPESKYAKFLLKGSYDNIWLAFDKAFQVIGENSLELADLPCIENYLNNPEITPVEELLTEILIPLK